VVGSTCRGAALVSADYSVTIASPGATFPGAKIDTSSNRQNDVDAPSISVGDALTDSSFGVNYNGRARATAGFGDLHANIAGNVNAKTSPGIRGSADTSASATASWTDVLFFDSKSLAPGTQIVVHASVHFDGILTADADVSGFPGTSGAMVN